MRTPSLPAPSADEHPPDGIIRPGRAEALWFILVVIAGIWWLHPLCRTILTMLTSGTIPYELRGTGWRTEGDVVGLPEGIETTAVSAEAILVDPDPDPIMLWWTVTVCVVTLPLLVVAGACACRLFLTAATIERSGWGRALAQRRRMQVISVILVVATFADDLTGDPTTATTTEATAQGALTQVGELGARLQGLPETSTVAALIVGSWCMSATAAMLATSVLAARRLEEENAELHEDTEGLV